MKIIAQRLVTSKFKDRRMVDLNDLSRHPAVVSAVINSEGEFDNKIWFIDVVYNPLMINNSLRLKLGGSKTTEGIINLKSLHGWGSFNLDKHSKVVTIPGCVGDVVNIHGVTGNVFIDNRFVNINWQRLVNREKTLLTNGDISIDFNTHIWLDDRRSLDIHFSAYVDTKLRHAKYISSKSLLNVTTRGKVETTDITGKLPVGFEFYVSTSPLYQRNV